MYPAATLLIFHLAGNDMDNSSDECNNNIYSVLQCNAMNSAAAIAVEHKVVLKTGGGAKPAVDFVCQVARGENV